MKTQESPSPTVIGKHPLEYLVRRFATKKFLAADIQKLIEHPIVLKGQSSACRGILKSLSEIGMKNLSLSPLTNESVNGALAVIACTETSLPTVLKALQGSKTSLSLLVVYTSLGGTLGPWMEKVCPDCLHRYWQDSASEYEKINSTIFSMQTEDTLVESLPLLISRQISDAAALEVVKRLAGIGSQVMQTKMLSIDLINSRQKTFSMIPHPKCPCVNTYGI